MGGNLIFGNQTPSQREGSFYGGHYAKYWVEEPSVQFSNWGH